MYLLERYPPHQQDHSSAVQPKPANADLSSSPSEAPERSLSWNEFSEITQYFHDTYRLTYWYMEPPHFGSIQRARIRLRQRLRGLGRAYDVEGTSYDFTQQQV